MLVVVMAAANPNQVPAVCDNLADQISTIHITSLCCVGGYCTYYWVFINTITTGMAR